MMTALTSWLRTPSRADPIIVGKEPPAFEYISLEGSDSTFFYCFRLTDIFGQASYRK